LLSNLMLSSFKRMQRRWCGKARGSEWQHHALNGEKEC
jgi:hypothetical protein